MADTYDVKKMPDLVERTELDDTDLVAVGMSGTGTLRKSTIATLAAKIRDKLTSLTFSTFGTTAKTIPGAVNELNSGKVSNIDSAVISNGTELPANADLNSYTTVGVYYSPTGARSETISNTPVTNAGYKLIVAQAGYTGTTYLVQIAILGAASNQCIYMRNRTTSAWSGWRCLTQGDMRSAFIYASTYAELYSLCTSMQTSRSSTFSLTTAAANAISGNAINGTFKGIVNKVNDTTFDFFGTAGAGVMFYSIRATLAASGATVGNIQRMVVPTTSSPLIKRVTYSAAYSGLAANSNKTLTADDFDISTPSGYMPLSASYITSGVGGVIVRYYAVANTKTTSSKNIMDLRNVSSSTQSGTASITINYIRSEAFSG